VRDLAPDRYLTDGRRLFRVAARFINDGSILVVIEDCATLQSRAYAGVELLPMNVRPVRRSRPSPTRDPSPSAWTEETAPAAGPQAVASKTRS
jgi:hypothetical protein